MPSDPASPSRQSAPSRRNGRPFRRFALRCAASAAAAGLLFAAAVGPAGLPRALAQHDPSRGNDGGGDGGGKGWWLYFSQPKPLPTGDVRGTLFVDLSGDGVQDPGERAGFAGAVVSVRGKDRHGGAVARAAVVDRSGKFSVPVPAGTYRVTIEDPRGVLRGYKATVALAADGLTVDQGAVTEIRFGWRPAQLLGYAPCLRIDERATGVGTSPSEMLLARLTDASGKSVLRELPGTGPLMTRREFLTILARTQCVPLPGGAGRSQPAGTPVFADVPSSRTPDDWIRTLYGLLAAGIPAGRSGKQGLLADGDAPILRGEAAAAVGAALGADGGELAGLTAAPGAIPEESPLLSWLQSLAVLPSGFRVTLNAGMTRAEGASMLARAAFVGGRVPLSAVGEAPWEASARAPSLDTLPRLGKRTCVVHDPVRSEKLRFPSVTPDLANGLWWRLRFLAGIGSRPQGGGDIRWLLTGRPAEFGVTAGQLSLQPRAFVTRISLVNALLVATCHPLEAQTAARARLGGEVGGLNAGTPEQIAPVDLYTGGADTAAFPSRVFHSAQRPVREYNLTLFRFARELQRGSPRDANGAASVGEAARLLASAALYTRVRAGTLTAEEAERRAPGLTASLVRQFTGGRTASATDATAPFTWGMFAGFLSDLIGPEVDGDLPVASPSPGEAWWEAVLN